MTDTKPERNSVEVRIMIIVFDSTVLISNFHLKGPSFRLFKWFIENTDAKLVVPKIVVEEVNRKWGQV